MDFNNTDIRNISNGLPIGYPARSSIPILVPMIVLIVIVNCFVLFLFATRKKLRTPSNYLLFSLAISDLMSGTGIVLFLFFEKTGLIKYLTGYLTFSHLTTASTAYHILIITGEKYFAIVQPLQHRSSNPKKVFHWLGVAWVTSSFNAFVPLFWIKSKKEVECNLGHAVFSFVTVFLLPYIFIVYFQKTMIREIAIRTSEQFLIRSVTVRSQNNVSIAKEKKCICIFVAMALLFLICWMPWFTVMFLLSVEIAIPSLKEKLNIVQQTSNIPEDVLTMFAVIRYCTCIINPLLYTFFKRDFMEACKSVFQRCKCWRRKPSSQPQNISYSSATFHQSEVSRRNKNSPQRLNNLHDSENSTGDLDILLVEQVTSC